MASYNRIKAQKASPIGTIMPWTGSSSTSDLAPDAIPKGWIVLRGQQLRARDYPLLAQVVGNLYGPFNEPGQPFVGISNSYPSYNDDDVFNLPTLSQVSLIDLESSGLTPAEAFVVGQYISLNGADSAQQPLTNVLSYIDINFSVDVSSELAGKIKGIDFEEPAYFDTLRIIPRKLGVEHTASHTHSRPTDGFYPSVELGGGYLGLFEAGLFDVQDSEFTTGGDIGLNPQEEQADRFNPGTLTWTAYDPQANSLPTMSTFRNFSDDSDVIPIVPTVNRTVAQYGNTVEYQDDNSCVVNVQQPAVTAPFPPPGIYLGQRNYYQSEDVPGYRRGEGVTFVPPAGAVNTFTLKENLGVSEGQYPKTLGEWTYLSGSMGWNSMDDQITNNFPLTGGGGQDMIVNATFEPWPDPALATGGFSAAVGDFAIREDPLTNATVPNPNSEVTSSGYYAGAINRWAYNNDGGAIEAWTDANDYVEEEFTMTGGSGTGMVLRIRVEPWPQPFVPGAAIDAATLEGYHNEIGAIEDDDDWTDGPGPDGWYNSDGMGNDDWFYSVDGDSAQYWNNYGESVVATCRSSDGTLVAEDGSGSGAEIRIRIEPARGNNPDSTYPPNSRWKLLEVVEPGTGFTAGVRLQCFFNTDRRLALGLPNTQMFNGTATANGILRIGSVSPGSQYPNNSRMRIESVIEPGTGYAVGDILSFQFNTPRRINAGLGTTDFDPDAVRLDGIVVNGGSPINTRYKVNAINNLGEGYSSGNTLTFPPAQFNPFTPAIPTNLFRVGTIYPGPTGGGSGVTTDDEDYYGAVGAGRDAPYPVTLNHGADAFTSNSLGSHNHFTVDLTMSKGQMDLPGTILINNMTTGNVEPINVDRGLSVQVNPNTPSLTVLYIIRAY